MSNKTRKWRSAIAMVLVISMLFSIFPVAAFAEDNMNSEPKEYIKYVSLGDSMTNGYGLEGYEYEYHGNDKTAECAEESIFGEATNAPAACSEPDENHKVLHWANGYLQESPEAYPAQFAQWLVDRGYAKTVELKQMAMSGMRAEDLHFTLEFDYNDSEAIAIANMSSFDASAWENQFGGLGDKYTWDNFTDGRFEQVLDYDSEKKADAVKIITKEYQDEIASADIISVSLGNSDFGVFLVGQLLESVLGQGSDSSWIKLENALQEFDPEVRTRIIELKAELDVLLHEELATADPELGAMIDPLVDAVCYTVISYVMNYAGALEAILTLNPDAEIILVGIMNTLSGMDMTFEGISEQIPMSEVFGLVVEPVNAYVSALPAIMQETGNELYVDATIYYAEAPKVECMVSTYQEAIDANNATVRDRFITELTEGSRGICVWNMLNDGMNLGLVNDFDANDVAKYVAKDADWLSTASEAKMLTCAIYLAFEEAIVAASEDAVVPANSFAALLNIGSVFDNIAGELSGFSSENITQLVIQKVTVKGNADILTWANENSETVESLMSQYSLDESAASTVGYALANGMSQSNIANITSWLPEHFTEKYAAVCTVDVFAENITPALTTALTNDDTLMGLLHLYGRMLIGNGLGAHPSAQGHDDLTNAITNAYENKHTVQDETIENLKAALNVAQDIIAEYYDEAYAYAYAYAKDAGYIGAAVAGIDGVIAALNAIDLSNTEMTDDFKIEVNAEIAEIIETLKAAKALITEANVLDDATFNALMALLNEAGEDIEQLVVVLEQAGVDVNTLVIIPALNTAYDKLINEVVPAIVADLEEAIAEGTEWLMDKAQDAIDAVIEALPEMAQFAHDYVYDYLYNNPEEVIAFFNEYGDEIIAAVGDYGPYALVAVALIADQYGDDILNFVMENDEEILEVTALLLKEHGPHAVKLINVYAEELGYCDAVREAIDDLEEQIDELKVQLEKELKEQLAMLNAQLANLYEQLENASGEAKAQIEAAIAELEALIENVEAQIAAIEAMIAELEAKLADAKEELAKALAELDALMAAIKDAIEAGAENIDEIIANVATAIDAVKNIIDRVEGIVDAINAKLAADKEDIIGAIGAAVEKLTSDWNALVEQFEVLKDAVNNIDELTAGLLSAINAYLENATQAALEELKDALYEMAVATGDEIYWFLYNNPDKVVGFFEEYGDEIAVLMEEYGPYALGAIGYLAMEYGDEIVEFAMENKAEIIEVTAMLLEKHGENAAKLINVYAEYLGWCDEVREVIADIEAQIDALEEKLADLYAQYEDLKAQLENLYAQLENASAEVKAEIEAAIAEIEALIAEVEKAIEEIENAIEALEAQLAAAKAELEKAIAAIEAVVEAIKEAIENGVETVEEILAVIEAVVDFAKETIAGVKTAVEGIVNAVEETVEFVEKLIENGIIAAEMIAEIIETVMDIIDGVKAELEKGDIEAAIEEIRNQLTNGYEELNAMLAAIDTAIAAELDAIVNDLEAALAQAQDEFRAALYNATHGEIACDAEYIYAVGSETVTADSGYAELLADEWDLDFAVTIDGADVILYQADPQIFVTALMDAVSGEYVADWNAYISDETVLAYLEQAKAELVDVLAEEYGEETATMLEPIVDSFMFAVVEYAITNIETIEYLSEANDDALIVAVGMYNPVQGLSVTYNGETIDIEALCQYLIEVTDVYNLLYAIVGQNAVFVDVSEAEATMMGNVDVDGLMVRVMELKAEAIALLKEATKALEENDITKATALMEQANALYAEVDAVAAEVLALVEALDSNYATEAGHAYIAEQILNAVEKADHECAWAYDDNEHCYYCENCGEEFVCGPHEFDNDEDTDCDVCGYERIIIDPTPEITTSSIVVYYLNENNAAIKDTTVRDITTTGSYRFNIPDPIVFNGVEYLFNSLIDKDASDSYEAELEEGRFFVDVDVMPTTSSVLEFVLKYISEATVASIEISSTDHKTNYYVGDALDVTNLKLLVTYTNSQFNYVNVTPAMISDFDTTTVGDKTVTITYEGATTQYTITVSDPGGQGGPICVDSVTISPDSVSLKVGNTKALTANITPANAQITTVVWSSSDEAVATVDQNGVVTAVAKGSATITVTVTDVDDCVETATCAVTVTKASSGGGSFGGGGGAYIKAKPEVIVPDKTIVNGVTVTADYIDYLTLNEVKDFVAKDNNLEVIGGRDSAAEIIVKPAGASFAHPVQLVVPVSKSALQNVDDVNKLTLALVTKDAQGNIQLTYVGGNYDASKGTFTAWVNQPGKYVLMEKLDLVKLELTIDRYVVFVNGNPIINDVPSRIVNSRTLVPAARVLHHMGCTVEWIHDTRTVVVTLPNGEVMNLPVDEEIPGFGVAPMIENGRTLVPIAYIADMMGAHVQWVENERKVIIVK